MKIFLLAIVLAALTTGLAGTAGAYNQSCKPVGACANNNSKECRDARAAFAEHHNGLYPEQWCNQWYQGQQGRWNQEGKKWQWDGGQGDQWFQGKQGHWFQEHDGWQFRDDQDDVYRKGRKGWQWSDARPKHKKDRD